MPQEKSTDFQSNDNLAFALPELMRNLKDSPSLVSVSFLTTPPRLDYRQTVTNEETGATACRWTPIGGAVPLMVAIFAKRPLPLKPIYNYLIDSLDSAAFIVKSDKVCPIPDGRVAFLALSDKGVGLGTSPQWAPTEPFGTDERARAHRSPQWAPHDDEQKQAKTANRAATGRGTGAPRASRGSGREARTRPRQRGNARQVSERRRRQLASTRKARATRRQPAPNTARERTTNKH